MNESTNNSEKNDVITIENWISEEQTISVNGKTISTSFRSEVDKDYLMLDIDSDLGG